MLPGLMQQPQATAAAPAAAPRRPRLAPGQCAVSFAPAQQCGGNLTGTLYNCSMFDSCDNTAWAGGCCPAAAPCMTLSNAGGWCQTCGGKPPAALVSASKAAGEAPTMCNQMGPNGDFDYGCVLGASLLFYEAQRSGKLPANNRIKWRGNTGLNDRAPNGASIAGGWWVWLERARAGGQGKCLTAVGSARHAAHMRTAPSCPCPDTCPPPCKRAAAVRAGTTPVT
jgi:hypothetical protein